MWIDGSFVLDELSGVGVGGCGMYSLKSGAGWFDRKWRHLELLPPSELGVERCVLFNSIRGPLQSVQRAELWGVILALQCSSAVSILVLTISTLFVMSLGFWRVVFLVGPFELTFDGDLLTIIERMVHQRCVQSVKVSKVKGHADDDMVAVGRVRNDLADRAADFGRRRMFVGVFSLLVLLGILMFWSSIVSLLLSLVLQSIMIAVLGLFCILLFGLVEVWPRNRRFVSLPGSLLGSQVLLVFGGMALLVGFALWFCDDDFGFWPYSVGLLV